MRNLKLIQGDITKACVDAIVNAANPFMLGGGGVDAAIHRAAGAKLLDACKAVKSRHGVRCPTGEARITEAGNLHARFVIHTVGPKYHIDREPEKLLSTAYNNTLKLALNNNCESIAFPAISCGVYGYPKDQAARIAIDACRLKPYSEMKIYFYLFDDKTYNIWQKTLDE